MNSQKDEIIEIDKKLENLTPIITKWMNLIRRYSNLHKNADTLYWYNERATLSTFAGAIWKLNGTALEEFSSTKIKSKKKKSERTKSGRTDLWFDYHGKEYIVEAKQISPSMNPDKPEIVDKLKKSLTNACGDAAKFSRKNPQKKCVRIGITFLTPYLPKSYKDNDKDINSKISELKEELCAGLKLKRDYHLLAWLFSNSTLKLHDPKDDLTYPGVVIAAKVA